MAINNKDYKNYGPFKLWTIENFPFIEADFDAITNYQLYSKIVEYMKKLCFNQTELQKSQIEVVNYVNNYFKDLDVQEEINNKLDEMASDGTLEEIITSYINLKGMICFNNLSDMKEAENLIDGSFVKTYGYYNVNDGGGAYYKIREVINTDVTNDENLIALHDENLVAELIIDSAIYVKTFGCYGDGTHDDTIHLQHAVDYATSNNKKLIIDNGTFLIDNIEIKGTINIKGISKLKSILKVKNTSTSNGCIVITDTGFENTIIENLKIDSNNVSNCSGIYSRPTTMRANNNLILQDLGIYNAYNGIDIFPSSQIYNIGTTIKNIRIAGCEKNGIYIKGTDLFLSNIISFINTEAGIKCVVYTSRFNNIKCYQNGKGDYSTLEDVSRINPLASGTYYKKYAGIISEAYNSTFSQIDLQENAGDGMYATGYNNMYNNMNLDGNGFLDNGVDKFTPISYASQNLTPIYDGIYFKNHNMIITNCLCNNIHYETVGAQQRGALFFDTSSYCKADIIGGNQYENKNYRYKSTNILEISNNTSILGTDVDLSGLTIPENYQFNTGSFIRKVGSKIQYHLIIKKTSGNITDGDTISGIPADYRPSENTFAQGMTSDNNGWSGYGIIRYQILTSGSIVLKPSGTCNFAVLDLII